MDADGGAPRKISAADCRDMLQPGPSQPRYPNPGHLKETGKGVAMDAFVNVRVQVPL